MELALAEIAMELARAVAEQLHRHGIQFAVVGAAAMSALGFPRQTLDFDLLTTNHRVLDAKLWEAFEPRPEVRRGDPDDPLAGVVRFHSPQVDVVVGRYDWQRAAIDEAEPMSIGGTRFPVVRLSDLILLKLDAGGYRDAADVKMMISAATRDDIAKVERLLPGLAIDARRLREEIFRST